MLTALNAKNKTGFVDGTFSQLEDQADPLYILWFCCNNMVLLWILNSLTREIAASVISFSIAKEVWKNLKIRFTQVIEQHQKEYVVQFLMGLNDSFTHSRGQILHMDLMPSIDRVLSLTLQEEKQRKVVGSSLMTDTAALFSKNVLATMVKNHQKQRPRPICTHCGFTEHTIDKCYKLHGYPPGYRQNSRTKTSFAHQVSLSSNDSDF
ncbi:uncharacterized protein LOC131163422 [Malania oleifera]|uniref:uncharacterized protein LOC131163422 n=1 Tax=Malania oleifera TaxID=397392 RepID=UPI0025AE3951|nr:uncharacterized protein LOC131163422 [Malania oleifera]